ncbi:MAG: hypothetical protein IIX44_07025 [Clostridia bacterium]|nr:hypothetical protein [Clostridia bacterium]
MSENERKFTRLAKIFLILALASFVIGNAFALFIYYAFRSELPSYNAEIIQKNPIASLAYLGSMLAGVVGCTLTAGIGDALSILFSSFSISFSSKAARACCHTPPCRDASNLKPLSIILLIVSILALLLTLPTYVLLSFFLGV